MEKDKNQLQTKFTKVRSIKTEVYSRVVGYYRPVQAWNEGKREEFRERRYLKVEEQ